MDMSKREQQTETKTDIAYKWVYSLYHIKFFKSGIF